MIKDYPSHGRCDCVSQGNANYGTRNKGPARYIDAIHRYQELLAPWSESDQGTLAPCRFEQAAVGIAASCWSSSSDMYSNNIIRTDGNIPLCCDVMKSKRLEKVGCEAWRIEMQFYPRPQLPRHQKSLQPLRQAMTTITAPHSDCGPLLLQFFSISYKRFSQWHYFRVAHPST